MKNFMPITGKFTVEDEKIVFCGGSVAPADGISNTSEAQGKCGIILFEDKLSAGEVEVSIEFDSLNELDEAEIIFNYYDQGNFMCAGIANNRAKYEFKMFRGQWDYIGVGGIDAELYQKKYEIKIRLFGSSAELIINNIPVLSVSLKFPIQKTNLGLWVRSKSSITISRYKATYQKSTAFIVSQFGDQYDTLYSDVIKPCCEQTGYVPVRADEIVTSSMILDEIISSIKTAEIIIAEITPDNPNVFYEIGYAHALNKPTILLCERSCREKLPFDISGFKTIFYDNSIGGKRQIEERLQVHLREMNSRYTRMEGNCLPT
ncbi:MAG: hypothetical protein SOX31_03145 [Eubacteriales bacterium]|nr:hypothetical protein [Eubacteriales bacterium]